MQRRKFIQNTAMAGGLTFVDPSHLMAQAFAKDFPVVRTAAGQRNFESPAIEAAINKFQKM